MVVEPHTGVPRFTRFSFYSRAAPCKEKHVNPFNFHKLYVKNRDYVSERVFFKA